MSMIKGIIFDYGGTIDTNGIHWGEFIWEQYRLAGMDITHEEFRNAYVHGERSLAKHPIIEPTDTFHTLLRKKMLLQFEYLAENSGSSMLTARKAEDIADMCYNKVKEIIAANRTIVEQLATEFPMVLVTNFYGNMPVVLEEFGLNNIFSSIVESSVVGIRKPDPALFALGVKALGMNANEIVVIGDSYRKDIYPASTLGCRTIWLKNVCWEEEAVLPDHVPTAMIDTLEKAPLEIKNIG